MMRKWQIAFAAAFAASLAAGSAKAETKALTNLDDARACVPMATGGFAVATGGGLAIVGRDGGTKSLTSLDGLPDTRALTVAESGDGLWVGTEGGAALVVSRVVTRTVGKTPVHAILASRGDVYFGTWGGGVERLAEKAAGPTRVPTSSTGKHVTAIAEHGGAIYAAYSDGPVTRLEEGTLRAVPSSPTHGQALASTSGRLLLGDLEGLFRVDGGVAPIASVDARGLAVSGDKLLVATYGNGLLAGSPAGGALRAESGPARWVRGVGARGALRCAATTEGLMVDEGAGWRKVPLGGPPSNDITTLAVSGARVAVGTFDHGAALFERGSSRPVVGLAADETVNASAWQGEKTLWLGTAHGLVRVDAGGNVVKRFTAEGGLPSSIVRAILVLSSDRLLVGTEEGAAFVEGDRVTPVIVAKKGSTRAIASPMHATWALAKSADGTLYIGTSTGLYWGKDGRYERASVSSGELEDDWVTALVVRGSDVFAGTYSGGVSRLTFDGGAARPRATALGGGYVNPDGLTLRGDELLAATMDGLLVRSASGDAAQWQSRGDRATGRDVTVTRIVGGALWVASRRGIAMTF